MPQEDGSSAEVGKYGSRKKNIEAVKMLIN